MSGLRVAMVGAGGIAARHLAALARLDVEVIGHLSRTRSSAERQAAHHGGRVFDALDQLLDTGPDAVWITVPPAAHGPTEHALIERGIPFFVEKPLASDRATPESIGAAVAARGLVTAVGYHWRAMDVLGEVRARLEVSPPHLVVGSWHGGTPSPRWWRVEAESGGQMVEQATHVIDLARHLVGDAELLHAAAVAAAPDLPDADVTIASSATVRFGTGALGVFTATCALARAAEVRLALMGQDLHVAVDRHEARVDTGRELLVLRQEADPFEVEDRAFLEAALSGDPGRVRCTYADALVTNRLTHAILEASSRERGRRTDRA